MARAGAAVGGLIVPADRALGSALPHMKFHTQPPFPLSVTLLL